MSGADFQKFGQENGQEGDAHAYAIACGSPFHFATPASTDDERTPRMAAKEWQRRRCQVITDASNQKPPWICVTKCIDEDALPIPNVTLTVYAGIENTTNWRDPRNGNGDEITVYFWRFELPQGKKGDWNFFIDHRMKYENLGPQPGQFGT